MVGAITMDTCKHIAGYYSIWVSTHRGKYVNTFLHHNVIVEKAKVSDHNAYADK